MPDDKHLAVFRRGAAARNARHAWYPLFFVMPAKAGIQSNRYRFFWGPGPPLPRGRRGSEDGYYLSGSYH
jgi:hypothetical protein